MKRASGLVVLAALLLAMLPVRPAAANHTAPPANPAVASGTVEGTELVEQQSLNGGCFTVIKQIFGWQGQGTYAGKTAGGESVVYKAELAEGQALHQGPLKFEVTALGPYFHGPSGTHGRTDTVCSGASVGSPITNVAFSVFATDHVYKLDGGGAQVPCTGVGSFARLGAAWHAQWTLDADCTVVGNAAGTPGTGVAKAGTVHTHAGTHDPCFSVCVNNFKLSYTEHPPVEGLHVSMAGTTTVAVNRSATVTANVTYDGVALSGASVAFSVAGPAATTPAGATVTTGATGDAAFTFTAAVEGSYVVTATATSPAYPGLEKTGTHTVFFSGPRPVLSLEAMPRVQNGDPVTMMARVLDESDPNPTDFTTADPINGVAVSFSLAAPPGGTATPAAGSATTAALQTDARTHGKAKFIFTGSRSGDYVVTASASHAGVSMTKTFTVHFDVRTMSVAGTTDMATGETIPTTGVIDPAGSFAYYVVSGRIVKVNLATFTRVGSITPTFDVAGQSLGTLAVIDPTGTFAYFASSGTATVPSKIVKVNLGTFTQVGAAAGNLTLGAGERNVQSGVIDPAGGFAYLYGQTASTCALFKINLTTFQRVGFAPLSGCGSKAMMSRDGRYVYLTTQVFSTGGAVIKVDLANLQEVGRAQLLVDEGGVKSAVIDPAGDYAYIGMTHNTTFPDGVVKVDLRTMQRVGSIRFFGVGLDNFDGGISPTGTAAVMDADGRFAYFTGSAGTDPALIKVDLSTFQVMHVLPLGFTGFAGTSNNPLVIHPSGGHVYVAARTATVGKLAKVALTRTPKAALTAGADSAATSYRTPVTVPAPGVLANDVDTEDADPLTVLPYPSDPPGGSVSMGTDGSFTYTPDVGFSGTDTFTYGATDGLDVSPPATVSVTVAAPPAAVRAVEGGACGYSTNISLFAGAPEVRGCGQTEANPATAEQLAARSPSVAMPLPGSAGLTVTDSDGAIGRYGPAAIFSGIWPDEAPGATPSGPITVATTGSTGPGGQVASTANIVLHPGADPLAPGGIGPGPVIADEAHSSCTASESGLSGSASFVNGIVETKYDAETQLPVESQPIPDDPPANYTVHGILDHVGDSFRVVLNEQILGPDSITVNAVHMYLLGPTAVGEMVIGQSRCAVDLTTPNANAPVAANDGFTAGSGQPLTVAAAGVLANDTDADGQALRASVVPPVRPVPWGGGAWSFPSDPAHGTLNLGADGSFTYTPAPTYVGPDSFRYQAQDARGRSSGWATVNLTVDPTLVAGNDAYTTAEDVPLTVAGPGVLANDPGSTTAVKLSEPARGTVTLNADGSFLYTPATNYSGPDSFTYRANDGSAASNVATVNLTITPVNDAPVANGDTYATTSGTGLTVAAPGVLANDTDVESQPLTAGSASDPAGGSVTLLANGNFSYLPDNGFTGTDTFTYVASDTAGGTTPATVTITVTAPQGPVQALNAQMLEIRPGSGSSAANGEFLYNGAVYFSGNDGVSGDEPWKTDGTAAGTVLVKDISSGSGGSAPTGFTVFNGLLFFSANGELWKSDGTAAGTVQVADINPSGSSSPAGFTVFGSSLYFRAFNGTVNGTELWKTDGTTAGTQMVKDINAGSGSGGAGNLTVFNGTLFFTATNGNTTGLNGAELWKSDGTEAGTVMVKDISPGPGSSSPTGLTIATGSGRLLFSASDAASGAEVWTTDGTEAGTLVVYDIAPGGSTAAPVYLTAFNGEVYFAAFETTIGYELWKSDGTAAGTSMVKDISPGAASSFVNSAAPALAAVGGTLFFRAQPSTPNVNGAGELWKTDGTAAGTVQVKDINPGTTGSSISNMTNIGGTLFFSAIAPNLGAEPWKSDGTEAGTVPVADINPGTASSAPAGFTNINGTVVLHATTAANGVEPWRLVPNTSPAAGGESYSTAEDTTLTPATSVLANDSDTDGNPLTAALVSPPFHGSLALNANGTFSYVPAANYYGPDFFTYVARDGFLGPTGPVQSDPTIVAITVTPVNDAGPVAVDDVATTTEDTAVTVAGPGVLGNDTDVDGDPLTAGSASDPAHGTAVLNTDGSFTYTPDADYTGPDSFTYTASDGTVTSNTATVSITVNAANDAPVAVDDAFTAAEDTPAVVAAPGVLGNDTDPDGDTLSAGSASDPPNGSVSLDPDGSFTYTPDTNFSGADSFTYEVSDGQGGTDTGTVSMTVTSVNDAPDAVDDAYTGTAGTPLVVAAPGLVGNDTDVDGDTLVAGSASDPAHGSVAVNPDGSFTYTTDLGGYSGTDSFTYQVSDGQGGTDTATVSLTLEPNPAPTSIAVGSVTVNEGDAGTAAVFTVTRSGNATGTSTVKVKTSGGTATAGGDYTALGVTTLPFAPFETTKTVTVGVSGDTVPEADETFNLVLSSPSGAVLADASGTATLVNDDGAAYVSVGNVSVTEGSAGSTPAVFTITRYGNTTGSSTVSYKTANGTAAAGTDFTALALTPVTFTPGEATKTVTVDVAGDTTDETNENFKLVLSAPVGATITDAAGVGYITDDDGAISQAASTFLSVGNVTVTEGDAGTTAASFTVTRSGNTSGASTVKYRTVNGSAAGGTDYTTVGLTTLAFAAGETTHTVTVDVTGDTLSEAHEDLDLALSAPTGGVISDATGTATIVNDDGTAYLSVGDVTVSEGDAGTTTATFTITRSGNTNGDSTVKYKTGSGSAAAGSDYTAVALSTASFSPGQTTATVTVDITGDTLNEANERFTLVLSAATGATIADPSATATITDDD